ncbi:MAG: UPF0280 family protein [Desulfobulbaceae bacterium]|nr:UPF0280 family protein [Desulfobulbaceae bacterium]
MSPISRKYRSFSWKETSLRVACDKFDLVTATVVARRRELERYLARHPEFQRSLTPVDLLEDAPEVACRMAAAARLTGLGPMAAVAGCLAQYGVEAALNAGCREAIVENGGDIYLASDAEVVIGLFAGKSPLAATLAFRIQPKEMPLALCSSSSLMGHSLSFGRCDLATVAAKDAALADAAVTLVCNRIRREADLEPVLEEVGAIPGVGGILAVKNRRIALWGRLPELVRNRDTASVQKITRHHEAQADAETPTISRLAQCIPIKKSNKKVLH